MRIVNGLVGLAFIASLCLQLNDPDPLLWALIYGAAAGTCVSWEQDWTSPGFLNAAIMLSVAGTLWLLSHIPSEVSIQSLSSTWYMRNPGVEIAREAGGAAIITIWMIVLRLCPRSLPETKHP
ncbi:MAG: transmembrane 220 family protein [Myxococcota bacterium]